jgi:hydroxyacylglutathione hydrolase
MILDTMAVGPFQSNCVLLGCPTTRQAIVVDPGGEGERIVARLAELELQAVRILLTHAHLDHVCGISAVQRATGAPIALHPADRWLYDHVAMQGMMFGLQVAPCPPLQEDLVHGQELLFGEGRRVVVIHTPGHSPGGVCFHLPEAQLAVVGDTIFAGSIGRTDLWGGDYPQLLTSIQERLLVLPPATRLMTGHGPDTTVQDESRSNPFLH